MAILIPLLRFSRGGGSREKGIWPERGHGKIPSEAARKFHWTKGGVNFLKTGLRRIKSGGREWVVARNGDAGIRIYARAIDLFNVSNYQLHAFVIPGPARWLNFLCNVLYYKQRVALPCL
jgi:hypothetical protein